MMENSKLTLPIAILLASIIFGGFFYASQVSKQKSIEKQQEIKMADERRIALAKAELEKKEYVAKRKNECYSIYEKERANWANVVDNEYNEKKDVCVVWYQANKGEWEGKDCKDFVPKPGEDFLREELLEQYYDCKSNTFRREF